MLVFFLVQYYSRPATGDSTNVLLWGAVTFVALAALIASLFIVFRHKRTEQEVENLITPPENSVVPAADADGCIDAVEIKVPEARE